MASFPYSGVALSSLRRSSKALTESGPSHQQRLCTLLFCHYVVGEASLNSELLRPISLNFPGRARARTALQR